MKNEKSKKVLVMGVIILIFLIILIVIGIILLNKNNTGIIKEMIGKYKITTLIYEDGIEENIKRLESVGLSITLELREDKTGTMDIFGDINEITYDENNITIKGEISPYTYENNILTMQQEGTKLVLTKIHN